MCVIQVINGYCSFWLLSAVVSVVVLTLLIKPHTKKKNMKKTKKQKQNKSHNRKFHTTDFKPNDPYPRVRATQDWQALFTQPVSHRSPGSPPFQSAWSVSDGRWTLWTVHNRNTDQLTDGGITQTTLTTGVRWILCLLIIVIRLITVSAVFIVWHRIYLIYHEYHRFLILIKPHFWHLQLLSAVQKI